MKLKDLIKLKINDCVVPSGTHNKSRPTKGIVTAIADNLITVQWESGTIETLDRDKLARRLNLNKEFDSMKSFQSSVTAFNAINRNFKLRGPGRYHTN